MEPGIIGRGGPRHDDVMAFRLFYSVRHSRFATVGGAPLLKQTHKPYVERAASWKLEAGRLCFLSNVRCKSLQVISTEL